MSGIRDGKITEDFWERLKETSNENEVEPQEISPKVIGDIVNEIKILSSRNLEGEPHHYTLPEDTRR